MKKPFNPKDWTPPNTNATVGANLRVCPQTQNPNLDIEAITKRIETTATDIAPNYADWRDLGFALADALGESGRSYYHRLSCFYPKYNQIETNKQYDNCLKAHGHGVTIKTLYHLAKSAGVNISVPTVPLVPKQNQIAKSPNLQNGEMAKLEISKQQNEEQEIEILPTISENIYPLLPDFLRQITDYANSREDADLLLLGSLVVTSACMPNVYGIYGGVIPIICLNQPKKHFVMC